jgi:GNAT superfamily N-acetyltransferase
MTVSFTTAAERPDLVSAMWAMPSTWPDFMLEDPVANLFYPHLVDRFPEHQVIAVEETGRVIGRVNSVPFLWAGSADELPDRGWDAIIESAFCSHQRGEQATAVSLLEARLAPDHQGAGLSGRLLQAVRDNVRSRGIGDLFGPVRPTGKSREPRVPLDEYVARRRGDGLPEDPWLRVHVRAGARIVKICATSITVPGTLAQWRAWTGLPLDQSGLIDVPGALTPLHVSVEHDHAVYVEPNVWVHHHLHTGEQDS